MATPMQLCQPGLTCSTLLVINANAKTSSASQSITQQAAQQQPWIKAGLSTACSLTLVDTFWPLHSFRTACFPPVLGRDESGHFCTPLCIAVVQHDTANVSLWSACDRREIYTVLHHVLHSNKGVKKWPQSSQHCNCGEQAQNRKCSPNTLTMSEHVIKSLHRVL